MENLTKAIQQAAWQSTPALTVTETNWCEHSAETKEAIITKRRLRKVWIRTRVPQDKTKLNAATRRLKDLLHLERNRAIQRYLEGLRPTEDTNYSLWKATRKLKHQNAESNPPIRKADQTWAKSDMEKAASFAGHLEIVFRPHHPANKWSELEDEIQTALNAPFQMALPINSIKLVEIKKIIKQI